MQYKTIMLAAGAAVVAIAVGVYVFTKDRAPAEEAPVSLDGSYSLRDLLTANSDMRCTFSYDDGQVRSNGVVYTAKDVIRVDSESTTAFNGMTVKASSIIDPEYVYTWMEGSADGYRIAFADMEAQGAAGETPESAPDYDREHDYDCEDWNVEEDRFQPPAGVTFIDPMEMLKGIIPSAAGSETSVDAEAAADISAQMCALCDQAEDPDSRSQCKAALGCG